MSVSLPLLAAAVVALAALPRLELKQLPLTWMATPNMTEVERILGNSSTDAPTLQQPPPKLPGIIPQVTSTSTVRLRRHQRIRSPHPGSRRPHILRGPSADNGSGPLADGAATGRLMVPLTELGERLSKGGTILFRGLNNVCSNTGDWRHWLPIYLHRFTGADVMVWNTLDSNRCRYCPRGPQHSATRDCSAVLSDVDVGMLVVVGAGRYRRNFDSDRCLAREGQEGSNASATGDCLRRFPYVQRALRSPYVSESTHKVHVPISTLSALNAENVFGFQRIIGDETFLKPVGREAAARLALCIDKQKENKLLYIARYRPTKGLVWFLEGIDPTLLKGYSIHVYGEVDSPRLKGRAQAIAKLRGLPVVFHAEVPKAKLLQELCSASGVIHYAMQDKNPRVAYEGLNAGASLFITNTSGLPKEFTQQPFVKVTPFKDYEALNRNFREYRDKMLAGREALKPAIRSFLEGPLHPDSVYHRICRDMGVCA
mmetsp:Transcript_35537/g.100592  ORF Transcript_35537/g.100592 Transcript_35537/m.100592 type:complete len:485 (+) Transcript_35537:171-1625(+)